MVPHEGPSSGCILWLAQKGLYLCKIHVVPLQITLLREESCNQICNSSTDPLMMARNRPQGVVICVIVSKLGIRHLLTVHPITVHFIVIIQVCYLSYKLE
uniref:Uncharacterized protein n=1 Tax=Oryza brachyantha TaxID=4533 RepID=J3KV49_ORYBR